MCPQPARPSVLCPQSSAHGYQLTRFLWRTGILGAVSQNVWWEEGRRSRELLSPISDGLYERNPTGLSFLGLCLSSSLPGFLHFPVSPPNIVPRPKSGLHTSKGMLTDGLRFGERELAHEKQLEKNGGPSPRCREAGRAVFKEEVSAPLRAWSWDPREKLQGGGGRLCSFFMQTVLSECCPGGELTFIRGGGADNRHKK